MNERHISGLPVEQLRRLDFLMGESAGLQTLSPPGGEPVQFAAYLTCTREDCMRYALLEFFGRVPDVGVESFIALITYGQQLAKYRMWIYSASQEDPTYFVGDFDDGSLVLVSEPSSTMYGMQRLRVTLTQIGSGSFEMRQELWGFDGYTPYAQVVYSPVFAAKRVDLA